MRNVKLVERVDFDRSVFVRYFNDLLHNLQSNDDLKELVEKLKQISDSQWRLEVVDSRNPSCSLTLLHSIVLLIIFNSPSEEVRLTLLVELIAKSPFDLWEIRSSVPQSMDAVTRTLKFTPRELLLQICKEQNGKVYLYALSNLLVSMPLEAWANDVAQYLEFAKKMFLNAGDNIPIELTAFVDVLSRNSLVDHRVWFDSTISESEIASKVSFISLAMKLLGRLIQQLDGNVLETRAAGTFHDFMNTSDCIVQRRNTTYLIGVVYEIAKRSSADHWDPVVDEGMLSVSRAPLNELIDLMLIGFRHELLMMIGQYILSKASRRAIEFISPEQKEKIAQVAEFSEIVLILAGREMPVVDLMDTLSSFADSCSRSYLLLLVVFSEEYISRLMRSTETEIIQDYVGTFSNIMNDQWIQELTNRNCPPKLVGLTLLHAVVLVLIEKLSHPNFLSYALIHLIKCVPAIAWDQPAAEKKVSTGAKSSSAIAHSPRHLIWNLCQRENSDSLHSVLFDILNQLPLERWQAEIPEYLKWVLKLFLKQGADLEPTLAAFFFLLVSCSPVEDSNWFGQFNLNADAKQKGKGSVAVVGSPVCILIDVFNAILKKMPANSGISDVLTITLKLIAQRSLAEDWDPVLTVDGKPDRNGPLNHLVQLLLDNPQNSLFCKIVEGVLTKATQESVNYISRENREKILAMPEFANNKKLLDASFEKKPVPKIAAVKVAPKPAAKKAVVSALAPTNLAKKPVGKKTFPKPSAKVTANPKKINTDVVTPESVTSVSDRRLMEAAMSASQQNASKNLDVDGSDDDSAYITVPIDLVRPTLGSSWADDIDSDSDDSGSKKSVQYRHESAPLFFNRKLIVKSGSDVAVSDLACLNRK